ncbi:DUF2927 domain-containing protein [Tropicibacter naphthalenivorans]|uniref:DUF2927 domain-containing protein n=1 Tax=Tropicibacter naphthalenivorans TaxID=441103 RepID=UPI001356635E|nr:DUF2927 domain-containing protein [Tropicibacter naphthalenivorans]
MLLWPVAVAAQDFIEVVGALSDEDFYRLVACAAPPGAPCAKPFLHWPTERPISVAIVQVDDAYLGGKQKRAFAAVERAVQYINRVDSGITLRVGTPEDADIKIYLIDTDGSAPISGTGVKGVDGATVGGARVIVWSRADTHVISRAQVIFSTRLNIRQYESAMIEEVTQALGLLTDIRTPVYEGVSVFSQDSNAAKDLGPQDIMALRRHYPKEE